MKTLIIAEKPSVARDIAAAIGRMKKVDDYFESDEYVVSSAIGHLVELFMPEDIDKKLRFWRLEPLPIIPANFEVKPIEKTKSKFAELKKLMARKDVTALINACDAGREGELIFTYICQAANCKKPVKRLWMQSMTRQGIQEAFQRLREDEEMRPLRDAARCRSEADWLIGINGTRAITTRMYGSRRGQVATVGRVQTPTLALVVERERVIRDFVPRDYWRITGQFDIANGRYEGVFQRPDYKKNDDEDDRADRLWNLEQAEAIVRGLAGHEWAQVSEEKKHTRQAAPRLYDLTTLQREANNRYGMPAGATLRAAQSLYEKHKLLTYPRTDSRFLPEDYLPVVKGVMGALAGDSQPGANLPVGGPLGPHARHALDAGYIKFDRRVFNNKGVSDHFAIIPTEASAEGKKLSNDEERIYDMVARRFVATFFPAAEFDVTTRLSVVGEHTFKTEGRVMVVGGWMDVYGRGGQKDVLAALSPKDGKPPRAKVAGTELVAEQTKPPPRYTEATLLTAMETAGKYLEEEELAEAMKEKGLGTPATRSATIDHLINEHYIERQGRDLAPTGKAEALIDFLNAVQIRSLVSAKLTGEWEHKLKLVEERAMSRDEFMKGIREHAERVVGKAKNFEEKQEEAPLSDIVSPSDGQPMRETVRAYRSQDGTLTVYKTVGNRMLKPEEVKTLVTRGQVGPLDGFRSKAGKNFSAILRLEEGKVKFVFDNAGNGGEGENGEGNGNGADAPLDRSTLKIVGKSPMDGAPVYETPNAYASATYLDGDKTKGLRISRIILGKTLPPEQISKLLEHGKTDEIPGFRSKRTKRLFSAYLVMDKKGNIKFEFPPREAKKTARKVAKKAAGEAQEG